MAYYQKILQADESVLAVGRLHWTIYGRALLLWLAAVVAVLATRAVSESIATALGYVAAACAVLGLLVFLRAWLIRKTTEVVVTNRRIIFKRGVIARHTEEMNISKVETVDVDQGIWGRILGYGTLVVRGTGGGWEPLRRLASPLAVRNAIIVG
jgi:uncharacterized membrane protein YdbT with pleckstrin-like domain